MKIQQLNLDTKHLHTDILTDITNRNLSIVMGKIFDNVYTDIDRNNELTIKLYN